jgi:hypothetical protein
MRLSASDSEKRTLEGRHSELEQKLGMMLAENERLNKVIRGKMGEIDDYRARIGRLEHSIEEYREI